MLRPLQKGRAIVQQGKFAVLIFKRAGLLAHPLFQIPVQRFEPVRHLVKAARQLAEFVVAFDREPHFKILLGHAAHAFFEQRNRLDDQHEHQVNQGRRADQRHCHQGQLGRTQPEGALLTVDLDQVDKPVDFGHEVIDLMLVTLPGLLVGAAPLLLKRLGQWPQF